MLLYSLFLFFSVAIVCVCNIIWLPSNYSPIAIFLYCLINTVIIFCLDAIIATIIHHLPRKWFDAHKKIFKVHEWENGFLDKKGLHISKWKDYIPELGKLTTNFSKSEIAETNCYYLDYFLIETCYAEVIHNFMSLIGFVAIAINPLDLALRIMLPLALINVILNVPPVLIQRFNRPKLLRIYELEKRKEDRSKKQIKSPKKAAV